MLHKGEYAPSAPSAHTLAGQVSDAVAPCSEVQTAAFARSQMAFLMNWLPDSILAANRVRTLRSQSSEFAFITKRGVYIDLGARQSMHRPLRLQESANHPALRDSWILKGISEYWAFKSENTTAQALSNRTAIFGGSRHGLHAAQGQSGWSHRFQCDMPPSTKGGKEHRDRQSPQRP